MIDLSAQQCVLRSQIVSDGYSYLENVIPSDQLDRIREEVRRDVWSHSVAERPKGYVPGFLRFNQSLAPYLTHPDVVSVVESFFGPHFRISMHTGSVNAPGIPRGEFHSDWPYNQKSQAHIPAPYPDALLHLVTFWMLSDFSRENGGTVIVPGSHKLRNNPSGGGDMDPKQPHPNETQFVGKAGTVVMFDARLWHTIAPNVSNEERVAVLIRYAPWWLNLGPLRPGSTDREDIVEAHRGKDSHVPALPREAFERLPSQLKPLLRHSVETT